MLVADCMRTEVFSVPIDTTLVDAMRTMGNHMVGIIPVLDSARHVKGVLVLDDLLTLFMPSFVQVLHEAEYVHDHDTFKTGAGVSHLLKKPLAELMRPPYFLREDSSLMQAMVFMHNHDVEDVPVVNAADQLVGIVSRVRVGSLFLVDWLNKKGE